MDRDPDLHEESKAESEGNIIIRAILNILNHFATIIGNAKDAELKLVDCHAFASSSGNQFNGWTRLMHALHWLYIDNYVTIDTFRLGYFQLENVALTKNALVDRITKHYVQQVSCMTTNYHRSGNFQRYKKNSTVIL